MTSAGSEGTLDSVAEASGLADGDAGAEEDEALGEAEAVADVVGGTDGDEPVSGSAPLLQADTRPPARISVEPNAIKRRFMMEFPPLFRCDCLIVSYLPQETTFDASLF